MDRTAAQSEIVALDNSRLLVLSRDGNGLGNSLNNPSMFKSVLLVDTVGFYLNVFHVNGGNIKYAALLKGASGTAFQVGGLLCIPLITRLSRRFGKQRAFLLCTASIVARRSASAVSSRSASTWEQMAVSILYSSCAAASLRPIAP